MADHLYLSVWIKGFSPLAMPAYLEKVLTIFPFSRFQPVLTFRVRALSFIEPPVFERRIDDASYISEIVENAKEFLHSDTAFEVECFWEQWRWDGDWNLKPSPVEIHAYGPQFERDQNEQIRIDLGPDSLFLPQETTDDGLRPVQSNVRSVLHLSNDLEKSISIERRSLWSDSGENFAQRFENAL